MMRVGFKAGFIVVAVMAILAASSLSAKLPRASASASQLKNPYAGRASAVKAGAALYNTNCSMCHGNDARGAGAGVNLRTAATHSAADGSLFWLITHGQPDKGMPPFQQLSQKERWEIVTYLKSLSIAKPKP